MILESVVASQRLVSPGMVNSYYIYARNNGTHVPMGLA